MANTSQQITKIQPYSLNAIDKELRKAQSDHKRVSNLKVFTAYRIAEAKDLSEQDHFKPTYEMLLSKEQGIDSRIKKLVAEKKAILRYLEARQKGIKAKEILRESIKVSGDQLVENMALSIKSMKGNVGAVLLCFRQFQNECLDLMKSGSNPFISYQSDNELVNSK